MRQNHYQKVNASLSILILVFGLISTAHAETYALLVGVGDYQMGGDEIDLPGIDKDIAMMQELALTLGISDRNIQTIFNKQATKKRITDALKQYSRHLTPADSLLLYFSAHGVQVLDVNGDEQDGADEALAFYDLALKKEHGKQHLEGIITDDDLGLLLNKIPAYSKMLIIDSCHSGTMSKDVSVWAENSDKPYKRGKSLYFNQLTSPQYSTKALGLASSAETPFDDLLLAPNTVVLSAAGDSEEAEPSEAGSLFTKSLSLAVKGAKTQTPYCWYQSVKRAVAKQSDGSQTPVFLGDFLRSNQVVGLSESNYIQAARAFSACNDNKQLQLSVKGEQLNLNDGMQVSAISEQRGWLYLLAVQKGAVEVFPWIDGNANAAKAIDIGEQSLPSPLTTWQPDFTPGTLLVLGVWLKSDPKLREFNWAKLASGEFGELSTATVELIVTGKTGS